MASNQDFLITKNEITPLMKKSFKIVVDGLNRINKLFIRENSGLMEKHFEIFLYNFNECVKT
ncbi:MAG: hypothetical protein ACFFDN_36830 [Candidatus Hodarchaeota archaeon]